MGFACPVCEIPHQDAIHLANHLAFTAMTHGDDHEAWLDDSVPGWADYGEADLAAEVSELAPDAEYDQVFEDTVRNRGRGGAHRHNHDHGADRTEPPAGVEPESKTPSGGGELDETTRAALNEARGLTAEMLDGDGTAGAAAESGAAGSDADSNNASTSDDRNDG